MPHIRIVLVDDHPLIHEAVQSLLAGRDDMTLVGQGYAGAQLLPLLSEHHPNVLVLDLTMPQDQVSSSSRFAYMRDLPHLTAKFPDMAIVILSQYLHPSIVQRAAEYNVKGYLLKSDNLSLNLPDAILAASRGGVFFSEAVSRELFGKTPRQTEDLLTERQRAVILTIARNPDDSYAQNASRLGISENTLKGHLRSVFSQLGVTTITSCIIKCMRLNLIPFSMSPGGKGIEFGDLEELVNRAQ